MFFVFSKLRWHFEVQKRTLLDNPVFWVSFESRLSVNGNIMSAVVDMNWLLFNICEYLWAEEHGKRAKVYIKVCYFVEVVVVTVTRYRSTSVVMYWSDWFYIRTSLYINYVSKLYCCKPTECWEIEWWSVLLLLNVATIAAAKLRLLGLMIMMLIVDIIWVLRLNIQDWFKIMRKYIELICLGQSCNFWRAGGPMTWWFW